MIKKLTISGILILLCGMICFSDKQHLSYLFNKYIISTIQKNVQTDHVD